MPNIEEKMPPKRGANQKKRKSKGRDKDKKNKMKVGRPGW